MALRAAFVLAGGAEALLPGRRLRLAKVRRVLGRFEQLYGIEDPLLRVRFERRGSVIVAFLDGVVLEALGGQTLLPWTPPAGWAEPAPISPDRPERAVPVLPERAWRRGRR